MFNKVQIVITYCLLVSITSTTLVAQVGAQAAHEDPVSYTIQAPETVKAGDIFTITTVFNIAPDWYLYAPIPMNVAQGKIPTKTTFKAPQGLKKIGALELPDDTIFFDTYRGEGINMSQKFQVDKNLPSGQQTITVNIVYQTCNDAICYPPVRKKEAIEITIKQITLK